MTLAKSDTLQALRAVAALLVVFDHAILNMVRQGNLPETLAPVAHRAGAAGVYVFFVISGYIMAATTRDARGPHAMRDFMLRRALRIAPLYYLATLVYAARLTLGGRLPDTGEFLRSFLFIPYFNDDLILSPILGPGWTLNFEMYFYLVFAVALLFARPIGLAGIILFFVMSIALGAALGWQDPSVGVFPYFLTNPIIAYFVLGIVVQLLRQHFVQSVVAVAWTRGLGLLALLALAILIAITLPGLWFGLSMLVVAPALVAVAATGSSTALGRAEATAVRLGDASYSIYLTHSFVVGPLATLYALSRLGAAGAPLFVLACLVACALAGILCYRWVEKPLLDVFNVRRWLRSPKPGRLTISDPGAVP